VNTDGRFQWHLAPAATFDWIGRRDLLQKLFRFNDSQKLPVVVFNNQVAMSSEVSDCEDVGDQLGVAKSARASLRFSV